MKPTIEQLQDALRRYNEGIQYLTENPQLSQDERDNYLVKEKISFGLCCSLAYTDDKWVRCAINEKYIYTYYWMDIPLEKSINTQINLLTRRRDKLIEIIEKYHQL